MNCVHVSYSVRIVRLDVEMLKQRTAQNGHRQHLNHQQNSMDVHSFRNRNNNLSALSDADEDSERTADHWNCVDCGTSMSPWLCLYCGLIHCGRYVKQDGVKHYHSFREHCICMDCHSYAVFCYSCDDFIHNDTDDMKIESIRKSLKFYNELRCSDHAYYSPAVTPPPEDQGPPQLPLMSTAHSHPNRSYSNPTVAGTTHLVTVHQAARPNTVLLQPSLKHTVFCRKVPLNTFTWTPVGGPQRTGTGRVFALSSPSAALPLPAMQSRSDRGAVIPVCRVPPRQHPHPHQHLVISAQQGARGPLPRNKLYSAHDMPVRIRQSAQLLGGAGRPCGVSVYKQSTGMDTLNHSNTLLADRDKRPPQSALLARPLPLALGQPIKAGISSSVQPSTTVPSTVTTVSSPVVTNVDVTHNEGDTVQRIQPATPTASLLEDTNKMNTRSRHERFSTRPRSPPPSPPPNKKLKYKKGRSHKKRVPSAVPSAAAPSRTEQTVLDKDNTQNESKDIAPANGTKPLRGLRNLGNTCFMNAVLQSLNNIDKFCVYFESMPELKGVLSSDIDLSGSRYSTRSANTNNVITNDAYLAEEMRKTLVALKQQGEGSSGAISPDSLFQVVWKLIPRFRGFHQQDAHEFLRCILDRLHSELRHGQGVVGQAQGQGNSLVTNMFQGLLQSTVTCLVCKTSSTKRDPFLDLSLDIPMVKRGDTILMSDVLARFFCEEQLEQCEQYLCKQCKSTQPSTKQFFISHLPDVLCLHLKRFRWGQCSRTKLDFFVDFPLTGLDAECFLLPKRSTRTRADHHKTLFDLAAVVVHHGSGVSSGHYTAFGLHRGVWHHFNDSAVRTTTAEVVAKQKAYILFYVRQN